MFSEQNVLVLAIVRGENRLSTPSILEVIRAGDVLIIEADSESLKALGATHSFTLLSDQKPGLEASGSWGLTVGIGAGDINALGSAVLSVIASNLAVEDLAALEGSLVGEIFGLVTDETLRAFDDGRIEAALAALDADFFNAGAADFANLAGGNTVFDQIEFDSPEALVELFGDQGIQDFFAEAIFGNN